MTATIGLRAYQIVAHKKGDRGMIPFSSEEFRTPPTELISRFIASNVEAKQREDLERSWFFEEKDGSGEGSSRGYVHYGTYGFESNFVNNRTKKRNYRRKVDDVEEIPLFYEIWSPEHCDFGLAAFQSFQGRSCIGIVLHDLQSAFERENPGYRLGAKKLIPSDVNGSLYHSAPVKRLTLIKRNASRDDTDRYFAEVKPQKVDLEISLSARRALTLGNLANVSRSIRRGADGALVHDGISFDEAVAQVSIGGRLRRVGVFGDNSEAGAIDITDSVDKGFDGHPTYKSLTKQSDLILMDFYNILSNN